jgi:solute carrier family 66 (lysosomal lysine-arginine transporter), member 1
MSTAQNEAPAASVLLEGIAEDQDAPPGVVRNLVSVLVVCAIGAVGWAMAYKSGIWKPAVKEGGEEELARGAQVLGYFSAVCYLG